MIQFQKQQLEQNQIKVDYDIWELFNIVKNILNYLIQEKIRDSKDICQNWKFHRNNFMNIKSHKIVSHRILRDKKIYFMAFGYNIIINVKQLNRQVKHKLQRIQKQSQEQCQKNLQLFLVFQFQDCFQKRINIPYEEH
ncbi:unnamed protein product [Paramecium octaurelia]|uniref:Uncharacterized protein n=1 Tax=Paramecium octaurelia TaxID=43137 RepID=A0A8S1SPH8_PAROT|nr:unnamed protein product [Paramecium octaurelia]